MKITKINSKIVNISTYTNWIFILVYTNGGIIGLGESTLDGHETDVVKMLAEISHFLIGKDPLENILPWKENPTLVYNAVISGLDIALWDIRGKYQGQPVYALLGECPRLQIPMYVTFNRALKVRTPKAFFDMATHLVNEMGNQAIKCAPFDRFTSSENCDLTLMDDGVRRIEAMRAAISPDIRLMVDCHWRFNLDDAVLAAKKMREHQIFWLEAPVSEKDPALLRTVREISGMRVAGFEMQTALPDAQLFLEAGALDVYMPDIKYIGGISKMMEINTVIQSANKLISPHNMTGPVASLASMHVSTNFKNIVHLEYHINEAEYIPALSDFEVKLRDGKHQLSDKPGLGIELNMVELDKHPYQPTVSFRQNMLGG